MEKRKVNYLTIVLAVCCVLTGILCFYLGTYFGEKGFVEKEKTTETNKNEDKTNMSDEEIDKLGKKLFDKTSYAYYDEILYFYNEKSLDYNSMKDEIKLELAMLNVPKTSLITKDLNDNYNPYKADYEKDYVKKVSKIDFKKSYQLLFGGDKNVPFKEFLLEEDVESCKLVNDSILCVAGYGGGEQFHKSYLNYDNAKLEDGKIIVYSSFLADLFQGYDDKTEGIYSDYNLTNKIGTFEGEITEEELFSRFGDKASKYKLTFNKDTNDNWYWVSTELIK